MRTIVAVLMVLSLASAVSAGGAVLVINADGSQQVMVDGPNGKSVLMDVTQVVDKRGGGDDTDPPPPPPTSDPIAAQIKTWASELNDPVTAQGLAEIYKMAAKNAPGQPRDSVLGFVRSTTDDWLDNQKATEKWAPWRKKVSKLIDDEEAKGTVEWQKFCTSVSTGLSQSAPNTAIPPEILQLLMTLLLAAIKYFFGGGIGGGTGV